MMRHTATALTAISLLTGNSVTAAEFSLNTFNGLDNNKYYTVTADMVNHDINSDSFIFAGDKRTVIPEGEHMVYIRGVKPDNGTITAGIISENGSVTALDFRIDAGEEYTFYAGGDITEANYILNLGGKYYNDNGTEKHPVTILSENGVNLARIRLSNNPGKGKGDGEYYMPEGYQDLNDCLKLARTAKEKDMDILFTFNLSDYWSNGERQIIPSDWVTIISSELGYDISDSDFLKAMTADEHNLIADKLTELTYNYVYNVMAMLTEQDTVPKYVSIGNEINGGLLFPFGTSYDMNLSSENFNAVWNDSSSNIPAPAQPQNLAAFFNAGYDAVKAASPETEVVIHLANGAVTDTFTWTLDLYNSIGAKYDIIGASYYPAWSNKTVSDCVDFCNTIYGKYNKKILIMETGFNWKATRKDGFIGQLTDIEAYKDKYPPTPTGQKGYLADLYNGLKSVKDGACIGAVYWDPLMIHIENPDEANTSLSGWAIRESDDKTDVNVVENSTLFDFNGYALPSLKVIKSSRDIKTIIAAKYDTNGKLISAKKANNTVLSDFSDDNVKLFIY